MINEFLEDYFLDRIIGRGIDYFEKGYVQHLCYIDEHSIEADVVGTTTYQVNIDLEALELCTCSCPYDDWCKHIVAVLYEIKDQNNLIPSFNNKEIPSINSSYSNITNVENELKLLLEPYFNNCYKRLTSNEFLNDQRASRIVYSFETVMNRLRVDKNEHEQLIIMFLFLEQIFSMAKKYETFSSFHRRFSYTFGQLIENNTKLITDHSSEHHPAFHQWFSKRILDSFFENKSVPKNPLEILTMKWILAEKEQSYQEQYLQHFLNQSDNNSNHSDHLILLTSLLALQCEKGARSLMLIRSIHGTVTPKDLTPHFQMLKDRQEWETMKRWFNLFLKKWSNKQLKEVRSFYEEMLLNTDNPTLHIEEIWSSWITHPNFTIYKQRMKMNDRSPMEKENTIDYLLAKLEDQLYNMRAESVYYQILLHEHRLEKAVLTLLKREHDPFNLTKEKQQILQIAKRKTPKTVLPLYHQFVDRLIQKKSRSHYQEAVNYIKELRDIYCELQQEERYTIYINRLKKHYKSFRALIQELKKIEQHV